MRSLRARLTLRLLLGGALLLGVAGTALDWQMRHALSAGFDATLRATTLSLATLTEQKNGEANLDPTGKNMPQFTRKNGSEVYQIYQTDGQEISRSPSLGDAILPLRASKLNVLDFFDINLPDGRSLRCAALRFKPQNEEDDDDKARHHQSRPDVVLVVGLDRAPLDRTLATLRNSLFLVGAGALLVLAFLVRQEVRRGLVSLDLLGANVAAIGPASLSTRLAVEPLPTELRPIAARLNELLARLEAAFARERRFTAAAAHELRTPLAELRTLAEVNLTTPATENERAECWRDALATTLRMESLSLRLLDLARAENKNRILQPEIVSLSVAFAAAWKPYTARAVERDLQSAIALPADLSISTDPVLLGVILGNICSNAVTYAPIGTKFHVTAHRAANVLTLHFQNQTDMLTAADVPQLFEYFWRKDAARSNSEHHGLGLGLAAEFATLLGGKLTANLSQDGELDFALELPLQPQEN